jgi:hypothetical protein
MKTVHTGALLSAAAAYGSACWLVGWHSANHLVEQTIDHVQGVFQGTSLSHLRAPDGAGELARENGRLRKLVEEINVENGKLKVENEQLLLLLSELTSD